MTDDLYIEQLLGELEEKGLIIRRGKTADGREQIYLLNPASLTVAGRSQRLQIRQEVKLL